MSVKQMKIALLLLLPVALFGLYIVFMLVYGTLTNYSPPEKVSLTTYNEQSTIPQDSTFTFMVWNVGYGGLGAEADFFYDGGNMVRSKRVWVDSYLKGIKEFLSQYAEEVDFFLLQEVDSNSKRSYFINQFELFSNALGGFSSTFATNYKVKFVPMPLTSVSPMGKVHSGVASYSKFNVKESTRYQFPGKFEWPKSVFMLDRCFLLQRVPLQSGKELVIVNSHNSAYDDGSLKQAEMNYLRSFLLEEYSKGNYVVVGADWNQCPPGFDYAAFSRNNKDDYYQSNIEDDFMPLGWKWVYDETTPTNRKLADAYQPGKTFVTLIDFYLVSPNIEVLNVQTFNQNFKFSDHHPIKLQIKLN